MTNTKRTRSARRLGARAAIGTWLLSLALLASGAGIAGAATGSARTAAHASWRDSRDGGTEKSSKDKSVDHSNRYEDNNSGDPQSPDPSNDG